ncbi:MAG: PQQ-dependent sugar dehydrogenase [Halioglobus sp.]
MQTVHVKPTPHIRLTFPCAIPSSTRLILFALLLGIVALTLSQTAGASALGRSGFSGGPTQNAGAVCSVCHAPDGAAAPAIAIVGPQRMNAGTTRNFYAVMVGGPAHTAGIGISSENGIGSLLPFDGDLRLQDGDLTHSAPKPFAGDLVTFSFRYTAPNYTTDVTLHAAGNSSNGALDLQGDGIAANSFQLSVQNGFEPPPPPPQPTVGELSATRFATGLNQPVVITHAGDDRLFVVERTGRVRVIGRSGNVRQTPFLNIASRVDSGASEMGLLGLAFHPQYASNGYFYVYYTYDPGPGLDRTRVSRFSVSADRNVADSNSEFILMEFEQPFSNHNGGDLHFGPDGYLYIASGDGGSGGDPQNNGQKKTTLLGKLLRIDVDNPSSAGPDCSLPVAGGSTQRYGIPPDNAFVDGAGGEGCDEIFALGARNPWRFSFDRSSGALWVADVGQNAVEEINYLPPGTSGGINLGWRCFEGNEVFNASGCTLAYLPPVHTYSNSSEGCSVTGGRVYRGALSPVLRGQYFFSDFCQSSIRALSGPPGGNLTQRVVIPTGSLSAVSTFGEDFIGELYVAEISTGDIYRLDAVLTPGDVDGDGDVDFNDIVIIWLSRGEPAGGSSDRRDVDGNGSIATADVDAAAANCSRAGCAVE